MPAGMPEPQKVRTSREVKSGERNLSFSKSLLKGNKGINVGAASTRSPKARDLSRLTMAAKPSHSPLVPAGSRYVSIYPMLLSTLGPLSLIRGRGRAGGARGEPV